MPAIHDAPDIDIDLADLAPADWLSALDDLGEEHGYFQHLGPSHHALFIDAGPSLLVTFESLEAARRNPGAAPRGLDFVTRNGWSLLAFLSDGDTWFRDPAVYGTFDRLVDDGFFEEFANVLFLGEGACGYAACAYSVAAPGARVLALRPQATLDPEVAGWDRRYLSARRRDFRSRYGFAPDMLDGASQAHVLYDPQHTPDAIHAALFRRTNVALLPCAHTGARLESLLDVMQVTAPLVDSAMTGDLDRASFARLWRARRGNPAYLRNLLRRAEQAGRPALAAKVARHGCTTRDVNWFTRKLAELQPGPAQKASTAAE
jgi:hypothetical protein